MHTIRKNENNLQSVGKVNSKTLRSVAIFASNIFDQNTPDSNDINKKANSFQTSAVGLTAQDNQRFEAGLSMSDHTISRVTFAAEFGSE